MRSVLTLTAPALAALLAAAAVPCPAAAADPVPAASEAAPPTYTPPLRGAPRGRIGGATRGPAAQPVTLEVLAPDHAGLTTREQPTLYWYVSRAVDSPVMLTIAEPNTERPLVEVALPRPLPAGIGSYSLQGTAARLQPGVEYDWSVAIVADAKERSQDILAGGVVKRVAAATPAGGDPAAAARRLAAAGLWYDAIAVLSEAIAARPQDAALRRDRAALLDQVGLAEVAAADRGGR